MQVANIASTRPQSAEQVHGYIARHVASDVKPPIVRPVNYMRIVIVTTAVLGLITFFSVASPYILPVIQNRNLWAAISLIAVLLFTSGHMFNHIRKVPYVAGDGKGGVSYFAGGFTNQFGLETQIVAAMCKLPTLVFHYSRSSNKGSEKLIIIHIDGVLSFATISLALKVPRMADPRSQQVAVFVWGFVMWGMYSFLLNVFRVKNGGYPFWLPPF